MKNKKYKVGIIGCGRVAGYLEDDILRKYPCTHIGAYKALKECEVIACSSRGEDKVKAFANKFNIPNYYTDYKEMLRKEKLDIVSIATYADTHAEITTNVAKNGVKAIFCEKAMATSLKEAKQMIDICKKYRTVLCINNTRRWDNAYIETKKIIENGEIGSLQSINGIFSGNLLHTGIHMFDIMIFLAGYPKKVSGIVREHLNNYRQSSGYKFSLQKKLLEDKDGFATILFENNIVGNVIGLGKEYFIFELDILGSKGRIRIGNGLFELWQKAESSNYSDFFELKLVKNHLNSDRPSAFVGAVKDIINAIETGEKTASSGEDAYASLELALAIYASSDKGGKYIKPSSVKLNKKVLSR